MDFGFSSADDIFVDVATDLGAMVALLRLPSADRCGWAEGSGFCRAPALLEARMIGTIGASAAASIDTFGPRGVLLPAEDVDSMSRDRVMVMLFLGAPSSILAVVGRALSDEVFGIKVGRVGAGDDGSCTSLMLVGFGPDGVDGRAIGCGLPLHARSKF